MNVLIVGSGAREHAIARAFSRSAQSPVLCVYGGSAHPGLMALSQHYHLGDILEVASIVEKARVWNITLAIIGPEAPLEKGLADALWAAGIPTIGPKQALARIETSKQYARDLMKKHNIPGLPQYAVVQNGDAALAFLTTLGEGNYVVKADGLMGGKGVKVAGDHLASITEALQFCDEIFNQQASVLIEEKLIGQEFSYMVFCDGKTISPMPLVQDHKRAYVGDAGPNTGGMGAYSAANHRLPFLNEDDQQQALAINEAVIHALQQETGETYCGILYGSFIATKRGVSVIEFNARFGDPEALNVLSILESDFLSLCLAMVKGELNQTPLTFAPLATVCKYVVPEGYPDAPLKNSPITIDQSLDQTHLYLGAVDQSGEVLLATGSRAAAYVGMAASIAVAEQLAESAVKKIHGRVFHREDIGADHLIKKRVQMMHDLRAGLCV